MRFLFLLACGACANQGSDADPANPSASNNISAARILIDGDSYNLGSIQADWMLLLPSTGETCDESFAFFLTPSVNEAVGNEVSGLMPVPYGFISGVEVQLPDASLQLSLDGARSYDGYLSGGTASWLSGDEHTLSITGASYCEVGAPGCVPVEVALVMSDPPGDVATCLTGSDVGATDSEGGAPCGVTASIRGVTCPEDLPLAP